MNVLISILSAAMAVFALYSVMKDYRRYSRMILTGEGMSAFIRYNGIAFCMLAGAFLLGVISYRTATGLTIISF